MNHARLLFAAARGARIEWYFPETKKWLQRSIIPVTPPFFQDSWRIHPADEHLQYGTVSSALRLAAEDASVDVGIPYFRFTVAGDGFLKYEDDMHRPLFLLMLSEMLADSGL